MSATSGSEATAGPSRASPPPAPPAEGNDGDIVASITVEGAPQFIPKIHLGVWNNPHSIQDIDQPTEIQINTYIAYIMTSYGAADYTSRTLWGLLNEDMGWWPNDKWRAAKPSISNHFRTFLVGNGVFVPHAQGVHTTKNIQKALSNDFHVYLSSWSQRNTTLNTRTQQDQAFLYSLMTDIEPLDIPDMTMPAPRAQSPQVLPAAALLPSAPLLHTPGTSTEEGCEHLIAVLDSMLLQIRAW